MSDDNEKKDKKTEAGFEFTLKNESTPINGTLEDATDIPILGVQYTVRETKINPETGETYIVEHRFDLDDYLVDVLSDIRTKVSSSAAPNGYQELLSQINQKKNNPELLTEYVSKLLSEMNEFYDTDVAHKKVGNTQEEIMEKLLTTSENEDIEGLICMTIHEFAMNALHDCGINAVVVSGGANIGNHATLLYSRGNGEYVWNNYGSKVIVKASNIKDAIKEVYKNSAALSSGGYLSIVDNNSSYQEFALEREAAFGEKMDKSAYNNFSPFDNVPLGENNSINGRVEISTLGNIRAGVDTYLDIDSDNNDAEFTLSAEYKKHGETELFLNSQSIGIDAGYNSLVHKDNGKDVFFDINVTHSYTNGMTGRLDYKLDGSVKRACSHLLNDINAVSSEKIKDLTIQQERPCDSDKKNYFSTFINTEAGFSSEITSGENVSLNHVFKSTLLGGVTIGINSPTVYGDARIIVEEGLRLNNRIGNVNLENTISSGIGADLRYTGGAQKGGISPVAKFNAGTVFEYNNCDNLTFGAEVKGYGVVTKPSKEAGVEGSIYGVYRPANSDVTIFGNVNAGLERQRLTIGGFNEQTENNLKLNTSLGIQLNPKWTISAGYSRELDKLNPTRNNSAFSLGCKIVL